MADSPAVCVVTQPLGSVETATSDLLEILRAITTVSLITIELDEDSSIRDDYEVVEISPQGMGSNPLIAAFRFLRNQLSMCLAIRRRDEEVVLFYGAVAYVLPVAFARLLGRTVIVEPRADVPLSLRLQWEQQLPRRVAALLAWLVRILERAGYRMAHAIIAYSPGMAEQLNLYAYEEKLYTDGARFVDTDRFDVTVPFEERDRCVGYVGRFEEEKGIRTLAAVAKQLPNDVTFRFVGDGSLRGWLVAELASEIEAGSVEVSGWVDHDEVPAELNELRLLVMPSEPTEGLPTMILEAMACGTPVYATPVSGVVDVIRDGKTGFLMEKRDVHSVADRIRSLVTNAALGEVSDRSRREIVDQYRFEASVDRYRAFLTAVSEYDGSTA